MREFIIEVLNSLELSHIIGFVVPFILGLFASFIVDVVRRKISNHRKKKFIIHYLKDTVLPTSSDLEETYRKLEDVIGNNTSSPERISVFETFNSKVLNSLQGAEYFDIFQEDYKNLNEIISMVEFLESNLPNAITTSYYSDINQHLKEKNKAGDIEHIAGCAFCRQRKKNVLKVLEFRVEECQRLQEKIHVFVD